MPLGHIGLGVPDLAAARTYYDAIMPLLDHEPFVSDEGEFSYRPAGGKPGTFVFFYPALEPADYSRDRPGLQHLAFMVRSRARVVAVHEAAVARGDRILHAPREFPEYHPGYFATFWLDPHGFMLEAVCHRDEDAED